MDKLGRRNKIGKILETADRKQLSRYNIRIKEELLPIKEQKERTEKIKVWNKTKQTNNLRREENKGRERRTEREYRKRTEYGRREENKDKDCIFREGILVNSTISKHLHSSIHNAGSSTIGFI